ncbi:MAG: transcription antitermination protein NusB [Flavobacteriales bacterium]|nr:transcription antitermination protein NusB [Flavobacteriales bacterium]MBK9513282.1 transcription antitermination protein NusB [Flavobacteriales bacterium]MBP7449179.1 transcription antitermination protein NusB [Flavobacteriales bacterium]
MLNRRYLRIKVYQSLYAFWQSDDASAARIEKELVNSIDRTYDLYLSLLLIFGELRHVGELRIEERKKKRLPTAEDLAPNRRFLDNPLLVALAGSERLRIECEKRKISWVGHHELFTHLLREVEASPEHQAYLGEKGTGFKRDQGYLIQLFTQVIANSEQLQEVFDGRSIYWLEDLDLAAAMVKRSLEQVRDADSPDTVIDDLARDPKEEQEFVSTLFRRCIQLGEEHEKAIAEKSSNWESDRIALSDMILMKMALTEVRSFEQIPVKVTMNEYIEIAKAYSTPKSKNFINGVLDKLFMEMKADGRIRKVGRGLLES